MANASVKNFLIFFVLILLFSCQAGSQPPVIHLNQIGFYPDGPKRAAAVNVTTDKFFLLNAKNDTVFSGTLTEPLSSSYNSKAVRMADFTAFKDQGSFTIAVPGCENSYSFEILPRVNDALAKGSLKGFYYQRMSTALPGKYAGKWSRPLGHPDDKVYVHASAVSDTRPLGTTLSSPKGWYDAGDYNKYVVNSGITMGTLLSLVEDFPVYCQSQRIAIPENENNIPDIIDEILWNLRWMLTMQDPADGGVYHKLTTPEFEGMVMPHEVKHPRYVVQKSTTAALDFAAVMAQASRIFKTYDEELPGLSDSCLKAAEKSWQWAIKNPERLYDQSAINKQFDPNISTGEYGDRNAEDEFSWAGIELFITTGNYDYLSKVKIIANENMPLPSWNQVKLLGYYSLARHISNLPVTIQDQIATIEENLQRTANAWLEQARQNPYHMVMGNSARDFVWGSSSVAANQGILLLQVYRITKDQKFLFGAIDNLDYLLGRNGTGYSFVTGFGDKTPMHPHHRPSESDGVEEPVPGLLSGGPNPGRQDRCNYPSHLPNEAFVDNVCSYASNEIAINWNAPLVYLVWAIEANYSNTAR